MKKLNILTLVAITFLFLSGCAQNNMYRVNGIEKCSHNKCDKAVIEQHTENDEGYDLAFIEFTERGNVFDRKQLDLVMHYIKEEEKGGNGIMLLVYTHGWKHNASNENNGDVQKFRKLLKIINKNKIGNKKVIGVYIGWRGLTLKHEPAKTLLTFWGRKNVAHQVGSGGVSEVLSRLHKITTNGEDSNRNIFVVAGHSFGAAVVLTAVKNILIDKIVNTTSIEPANCHTRGEFKEICKNGCYKTKSFGDGIVLLNPAVEANELMQIKALVTKQRCYARAQPKLLHILTSNSDKATRYAFGTGQFLGVSIREREEKLKRFILDEDTKKMKEISLKEFQLDTTTIGHYPPFRTGLSYKCEVTSGTSDECYKPCNGNGDCVDDKDKNESFPVSPFEPLSIVYTDKNFIKGHTDIFNEKVVAYIASSIIENQYKKNSDHIDKRLNVCVKQQENGETSFDFNNCLHLFRSIYKKDICKEFPSQCASTL